MNIDTTQIENFDSMSADELREFVKAFEYNDNAEKITSLEADVKRYKSANDKLSSENADWKKKINASKSQEEQDKIARDEAFAELQNKYEEAKKENEITKFVSKYRSLGFTEELANETAVAQFEGNTDVVFANMEKFKKEFENVVRADVTKGTPKPDKNGKSAKAELTKEDFDKMGYKERTELFNTNRELYDKLRG